MIGQVPGAFRPPEVRVADLRPGDVVVGPVVSSTFITASVHPLWPGLVLVVWRMSDGRVSLDALSAAQMVGRLDAPRDEQQRQDRLRAALLGQAVTGG